MRPCAGHVERREGLQDVARLSGNNGHRPLPARSPILWLPIFIGRSSESVQPRFANTGGVAEGHAGTSRGRRPTALRHTANLNTSAVQFVLAISGTAGFAVCDTCRNVYAPLRTPRAGERHYCRTCRTRKEPQRYAAARYRKGETRGRVGPHADPIKGPARQATRGAYSPG